MKILVVDDEQLVRWFVERALKKWGYNVVSVSNSADALQKLKDDDFDVLFTDLRMPEGYGTQLIKSVSELPNKNPKIIVCSAFITPESERDFRQKGFGVLKKPFKLTELEQTIKVCAGNA